MCPHRGTQALTGSKRDSLPLSRRAFVGQTRLRRLRLVAIRCRWAASDRRTPTGRFGNLAAAQLLHSRWLQLGLQPSRRRRHLTSRIRWVRRPLVKRSRGRSLELLQRDAGQVWAEWRRQLQKKVNLIKLFRNYLLKPVIERLSSKSQQMKKVSKLFDTKLPYVKFQATIVKSWYWCLLLYPNEEKTSAISRIEITVSQVVTVSILLLLTILNIILVDGFKCTNEVFVLT